MNLISTVYIYMRYSIYIYNIESMYNLHNNKNCSLSSNMVQIRTKLEHSNGIVDTFYCK